LESLIFVGYTRQQQQQQQPEFFGEIANLFDGDIIRFPFFFPPKTTTTTSKKRENLRNLLVVGLLPGVAYLLGAKTTKNK
jgi:hypothetical protein